MSIIVNDTINCLTKIPDSINIEYQPISKVQDIVLSYSAKVVRSDDYIELILDQNAKPYGRDYDRFMEEFIKTAENKHGGRIIINALNIKNQAPLIDAYRFGVMLARHGQGRKIKLAICASVEIQYPDQFFENVLSNRGLISNVFDNRNSAIDWLDANSAPLNNSRHIH